MTQGICSCLPDVTPAAHRALYETVVDFYEAEREAGDGGDDELYVKRTSYGQVHRLAELWNLLVSVGVSQAFHAVLLRAILALRVCRSSRREFRRACAAELSVRADAHIERGEQVQGAAGARHPQALLHRRALRTRVRAHRRQQVARQQLQEGGTAGRVRRRRSRCWSCCWSCCCSASC